MRKVRLRKVKQVTKATGLVNGRSGVWLRNLTHTKVLYSGSVLGPEDTGMKSIQSVRRGSRCASIQLWYNMTTRAVTHTKIWEVTELSSQELRLLSHWKLGSNSSSAAYKPCDLERGLISTSAKREGDRAAETKAKKQRESSTCGNRETRVYGGNKPWWDARAKGVPKSNDDDFQCQYPRWCSQVQFNVSQPPSSVFPTRQCQVFSKPKRSWVTCKVGASQPLAALFSRWAWFLLTAQALAMPKMKLAA